MNTKQKKQTTMLALVTIPNVVSLAGLVLTLTGKAKQLAYMLKVIARILCVPLCLAAAILAISDWKREENLDNQLITLWIAFQTVLTLRVFASPDEDEEETEEA